MTAPSTSSSNDSSLTKTMYKTGDRVIVQVEKDYDFTIEKEHNGKTGTVLGVNLEDYVYGDKNIYQVRIDQPFKSESAKGFLDIIYYPENWLFLEGGGSPEW